MKRSLRRLLILALVCSCARLAPAGGVTVITHGFNSDVASWIVPMQGRIARYGSLAPSNTTCYTVSIMQNGQGQYVSSSTYVAGTNPLAAASGELLIKLDWSTLSGLGGPSTLVIATNAANALLATNLIPDLGGRALAELPLHLVGHSRGASVMAETARLLGAQGIWVDHITTLDPVPVSSFGDPAMKLYANVLYVDNYWQNLNATFLDPQGQSLTGAYNRKLTNLNGAASSAHSDVHLWYHGTIDFTTPITVDGATITSTERANWWTAFEQQGTNAGFRLSLIGGGNRLSTNEPAGAGNGRFSDGYNKNYSLGASGSPNRVALPVNSGAWPSPILLTHSVTNPLPAGASFELTCMHQTGVNQATNVAVQVLLDRDANPWSGNETPVLQETIAGSGTNSVATWTETVPTDAMTLEPGTYRVLTKLSYNGRNRYLYAPSPVTVTASTVPPWLTAVGARNGGFQLRVHAFIGQRVVTEATTNLIHWSALVTNVVAGAGFDVFDAAGIQAPTRFYRAVLLP